MPLTSQKETLVVGSGASGLTIALLLAKAGRKVSLLEKQRSIGGYLRRFARKGLRFDTGFHFTGGFEDTLPQILQVLNLKRDIAETPLPAKIYLQETGRALALPNTGCEDLAEYLAAIFPRDADAIRRYYQLERQIVADTPIFDLKNTAQLLAPQFSLNDTITLQEYFQRQRFSSPEVETVLGVMSFCHGTPPEKIPFAQHCRVSCGLNNHLARVKYGGDAFINGFKRELKQYGVTIRTNTSIVKMLRFSTEQHCQEVLLSNGENLQVEDIFFAVHPEAYLALFPEKLLSTSIRRRFGKYQDTCSFFSIYAALADDLSVEQELLHFISKNNLNELLAPGSNAYGTGMVTTLEADGKGVEHKTFTAFRNMYVSEVVAQCGQDVLVNPRNQQYLAFKRRISNEIYDDILKVYPQYANKLSILASASPLTCLNYSPPRGSAYGVKIKIGESRLAGRLPIPNCYALGHHAIMPGVLGCLLGAFITFRQAVGADRYKALIKQTL